MPLSSLEKQELIEELNQTLLLLEDLRQGVDPETFLLLLEDDDELSMEDDDSSESVRVLWRHFQTMYQALLNEGGTMDLLSPCPVRDLMQQKYALT